MQSKMQSKIQSAYSVLVFDDNDRLSVIITCVLCIYFSHRQHSYEQKEIALGTLADKTEQMLIEIPKGLQ